MDAFRRPKYFKHKDLPEWVYDQYGGAGKAASLSLREQRKKDIKRAEKEAAAAAAAAAAERAQLEHEAALGRGASSGAAAAAAAAAAVAVAAVPGTPQATGPPGTVPGSGPMDGPLAPPDGRLLSPGLARAPSRPSLPSQSVSLTVKPLWLATVEAHARLPALCAPGDAAERTPWGDFAAPASPATAAAGESRHKPGPPPAKRIRAVVLLS